MAGCLFPFVSCVDLVAISQRRRQVQQRGFTIIIIILLLLLLSFWTFLVLHLEFVFASCRHAEFFPPSCSLHPWAQLQDCAKDIATRLLHVADIFTTADKKKKTTQAYTYTREWKSEGGRHSRTTLETLSVEIIVKAQWLYRHALEISCVFSTLKRPFLDFDWETVCAFKQCILNQEIVIDSPCDLWLSCGYANVGLNHSLSRPKKVG